MKAITIAHGYQGTQQTLHVINGMGRAGKGNSYVARFILMVPLRMWNDTLARYWNYVEEAEETIRGISTQMSNIQKRGMMEGDCDDAAVVAVALAVASRLPYAIVAVRRSDQADFSHVFVEVQGPGFHIFRIDPTAPKDTDYHGWERMEVSS